MKKKKKEIIKKQKFWRFMGYLPLILFMLVSFVYLIIRGYFISIIIFLILVFVFCLAVMWMKYCSDKEKRYINDEIEYFSKDAYY